MSDYLAAMALGKAISNASDAEETSRSIQHHNTMMRGYDKQILNSQFQANLAVEKKRADAEKDRAESMEQSANFYRQLLSRPMTEIAKYDMNFAKAHALQEQTLSDWVLSQKAFKDLSYDLGFSLGYEDKEVDKLYVERAIEIADGKNPHEFMPERFTPYVNQSKDNIVASIEQKNKIIAKNNR